MKKIEAIIKAGKLDGIKETLTTMGIKGMTVTEARGFGRQKGQKEIFRGAEYKIDFLPKLKLEIIAKEEDVNKIVKVIQDHAKTGEIGDGKIFVIECAQAIRIRTGEQGEEVLY